MRGREGRAWTSGPTKMWSTEAEPEECAAMLHSTSSGEGPEDQALEDAEDAEVWAPLVRPKLQGRRPWRLVAAAALTAACAGLCAAVAVISCKGPMAGLGTGGEGPMDHQRMTAEDVASLLSAYARLGRPPPELRFSQIADRAQEVVRDMSANDVARTLDSYAKLGKKPTRALLDSLGQRAQEVAGDMSAQDVTDTITAFADLGERIDVEDSEAHELADDDSAA